MKKFIPKLLLFAFVAITVAACSKKDSDKPTSDIVGKWSVKSDTTRTYDNKGVLVNTYVNGDIKATDYAQFNKDGTGTESEYGIVINYKYTYTNNILTFMYEGSNIPGATGGIDVATVVHLDAHSLYTIQTTPDTLGNVIYQDKESLHFTK